MRIGTRLFFALVPPIVLVIALLAYLDQRRSQAQLREELIREGKALARMTQLAIEEWVRDGDWDRAESLIGRITGYERVLGARLFDAIGRVRYQSEPLERHPFSHPDALAEVLRERQAVGTRRMIDGVPVFAFIMPITADDGSVLGAVQVLQLESVIEADARASRNAILQLAAVTVVLIGAAVFLVTRLTVGRSVDNLVRSIRRVAGGDLAARVPATESVEFRRIGAEFNGMCERLAAAHAELVRGHEERLAMENRLRTAEQLAGIGRLASGLAHEIGTPLNVIGGRTESLQRRLSGNVEAQRSLEIVTAQIERIARIVQQVLDFARHPQPVFAPTDVCTVMARVLEFTEQRLAERRIEVDVQKSGTIPRVEADADQLYQVFLNLVINALDAMPDGGRLHVSHAVVRVPRGADDAAPQEFLRVAVEDDGVGIPPEHLARVFEPFYSTKEVGKGTGLGLSIAYGIMRLHGGWLDAQSRAERGACFAAYLPLERSAERETGSAA